MTTALVWFRNDLRLEDNPSLARALNVADQMLCVYVLDPRFFGKTSFGFERTGTFRKRFLRESLEDLRSRIERLGGTFLVVRDRPEEVLPRLADQISAEHVFCQQEYASEESAIERKVARALGRSKKRLVSSSANTLYHVDDLPFSIGELPEVFSRFRGKVEKRCDVQPPIPLPTRLNGIDSQISQRLLPITVGLEDTLPGESQLADPRGALEFTGGETAGKARLDEYFWEADCLREYKVTRNGMLGANYSSKFSPWLALGCLSPRWIHHQVAQYEQQRTKNDSTYWMVFELLWRDYFAFIVAKHGRKVFQVGGLREQQLPWKQDWPKFDLWRDGMTGFPLIDANMRELSATGFMSNRGRQNVASFLTKNLGVDWRMGAEWFESQLIDYDPCSNYGNWNYSAGVGNDARGFRWFNTLKQSNDYDPHGKYVKLWLPELAHVPMKHVHTPWKMHRTEQKRCGVTIGVDYPPPTVDLFESSSFNKSLYEEAAR